MSGFGGKVAIIGTGTIKFGENFHQSLSDMIFEAVNLAMADAKIESRQLQAAWVGARDLSHLRAMVRQHTHASRPSASVRQVDYFDVGERT